MRRSGRLKRGRWGACGRSTTRLRAPGSGATACGASRHLWPLPTVACSCRACEAPATACCARACGCAPQCVCQGGQLDTPSIHPSWSALSNPGARYIQKEHTPAAADDASALAALLSPDCAQASAQLLPQPRPLLGAELVQGELICTHARTLLRRKDAHAQGRAHLQPQQGSRDAGADHGCLPVVGLDDGST